MREAGLLGDVGDAGLEEAGVLEHRPWPTRAGGPGSARPCGSGGPARRRRRSSACGSRPWPSALTRTSRPSARPRPVAAAGRRWARARAVVVGEGAQGLVPARPPHDAVDLPGVAAERPSCRSSCSTASAARRRPGRRRAPTSGPRSGWLAEELVERRRVEGGAVPQLERDHHPIADRIVGHGVHGDRADVGVAADDRLDRAGREVLAVDPQPLVRPAGEVQPAVGVAVGEVARPVGAVAEPLVRWPPRCGSSPRSPTPAAVSTISPTASSRFVTRPSSSKTAGGHSSPVSGSSTFTESSAVPSAPARHRRVAADDDHALGRAVAVPHVAAEAAGEVLDVVLRGLVADGQPQRDGRRRPAPRAR